MSERNPFLGSTFAERKAAREVAEQVDGKQVDGKQVDGDVDSVEDKAVGSAQAKSSRRRKS